MTPANSLTLTAIGALALAAAACTPAADRTDAADATDTDTTTHTVVETREVPSPPVVIEREVPVPTPPVVVERDRRDGDTTTVRAGQNGIEVETTNR
jgi:hypothetical protein